MLQASCKDNATEFYFGSN